MDDAIRTYRQAFVLAILRRGQGPMTAAEIAETFATMALHEGHAPEFWRTASPSSVSGHLRSLEQSGEVEKAGERKNTRNGRPEPLWKPTAGYDAKHPIPNDPLNFAEPHAPPRADTLPQQPAARLGAASPYAHMSKPQLLALLSVHDEFSGATARFLSEVRDITARARRELAAVGLEAPAQ